MLRILLYSTLAAVLVGLTANAVTAKPEETQPRGYKFVGMSGTCQIFRIV